MSGIYRRVVSWDRYKPKFAPHGASAVVLTLSCGHLLRRKGHVPIPQWAHCKDEKCTWHISAGRYVPGSKA